MGKDKRFYKAPPKKRSNEEKIAVMLKGIRTQIQVILTQIQWLEECLNAGLEIEVPDGYESFISFGDVFTNAE